MPSRNVVASSSRSAKPSSSRDAKTYRNVYLLTGAKVGIATGAASTTHWGVRVGETVFQMPKVHLNKLIGSIKKEAWTSQIEDRFKSQGKFYGKTSWSDGDILKEANRIVKDFRSYNLVTRNCQELAVKLINAILADGAQITGSRTIRQHLLNGTARLALGAIYGTNAPPGDLVRKGYIR